MARKWFKALSLKSFTSRRSSNVSRDIDHAGVDENRTEDQADEEQQSGATTKTETVAKGVATDDVHSENSGSMRSNDRKSTRSLDRAESKRKKRKSSSQDETQSLDRAQSTKRKVRKKTVRNGSTIREKTKKKSSRNSNGKAEQEQADGDDDVRESPSKQKTNKKKPRKKKKRKTSNDRDIDSNIKTDDSYDPDGEDTVNQDDKQTIKREKSKRKKKPKKKGRESRKDGGGTNVALDEKDLLIQNLTTQLKQKVSDVKSLNETVESLQQKLKLMELTVQANNDNTKAENKKENIARQKRRAIDDEHTQNSKESDQREGYPANESSIFASSDSQLSLLSEVTPSSTVDDDERSIEMGDVFDRSILQDSSEEKSSPNDTEPAVAQTGVETRHSPNKRRQRQEERTHRDQNFMSCVQFQRPGRGDLNKMRSRNFWASAPNLTYGEYDWNRTKDRDDLFDLPETTQSNTEELSFGNYASDNDTPEDENNSNDHSQFPTKDEADLKFDDDSASLDDGELFDTHEKTPHPKKPLLAAALRAKSMSNLDGGFEGGEDDSASLDDDELFHSPKKSPLAKKPLLAAALKAKSMSNLDGAYEDGEDDTASLNDDELFDLPEGPLSKKPLLAAALKAKSMSNLDFAYDEDDSASLDDNELFDLPDKVTFSKKPLLAAALKAKSMSNLDGACEDDPGSDSDNDNTASLSDDELFDSPKKSPLAKKPLLAAALKAKSMSNLDGAYEDGEDDSASLDDDELFDLPEDPLSKKTLLAAALKAKSMSNLDGAYEDGEDDSASLDDDELFDLPEDPLSKKTLLAAALKAKSMSNLDGTCEYRQDDDADAVSLDDDELFDLPEGPLSKKPLLAAALKAKSMSNLDGAYEYREDDDTVSLDDDKLFDLPEGPLSKKPLLAAALKAKSMSSLNYGDDDDNASLSGDELFDSPKKSPVSKKPLLAAAMKAKSVSDSNYGHKDEDDESQVIADLDSSKSLSEFIYVPPESTTSDNN